MTTALRYCSKPHHLHQEPPSLLPTNRCSRQAARPTFTTPHSLAPRCGPRSGHLPSVLYPNRSFSLPLESPWKQNRRTAQRTHKDLCFSQAATEQPLSQTLPLCVRLFSVSLSTYLFHCCPYTPNDRMSPSLLNHHTATHRRTTATTPALHQRKQSSAPLRSFSKRTETPLS